MFRNLRKKTKKNLNWKKKSKIILFLAAQFCCCPLHYNIFKSTNNFEKKITYLGRSQRGAPILKIEKNLVVNPRNGTLTKIQKTPVL